MDKRDKLYELHGYFDRARGTLLTKQQLLTKLECSDSTLKRRIKDLKNTYGAPLKYDPQNHGWYYQKDVSFELPGLWFNDQELYALLTLEQLLENLGAGLVSEQLTAAKDRIKVLLSTKTDPEDNISNKLRLITVFHREFNKTIFQEIAKAVFEERQLEIDFINRQTQEKTTRTISPQRIVHYKDSWYVDCFCHLRKALRTFSIDSISQVKQCHSPATIIHPEEIDQITQSTYGIFSGQATEIAILHFQPPASHWVAKETWHPDQQGQWLDNHVYQLKIPYQNPKELLADILKYADKVIVKSPESLRQSMRNSAKRLLENHK